jgi:hypothetical protein
MIVSKGLYMLLVAHQPPEAYSVFSNHKKGQLSQEKIGLLKSV